MEQQLILQKMEAGRLNAIPGGTPDRRASHNGGARVDNERGQPRTAEGLGGTRFQLGGLELERAQYIQPRVRSIFAPSDGSRIRPARRRHGLGRPRHHDTLVRRAFSDLGIQPMLHHGRHRTRAKTDSFRCKPQITRTAYADREGKS